MLNEIIKHDEETNKNLKIRKEDEFNYRFAAELLERDAKIKENALMQERNEKVLNEATETMIHDSLDKREGYVCVENGYMADENKEGECVEESRELTRECVIPGLRENEEVKERSEMDHTSGEKQDLEKEMYKEMYREVPNKENTERNKKKIKIGDMLEQNSGELIKHYGRRRKKRDVSKRMKRKYPEKSGRMTEQNRTSQLDRRKLTAKVKDTETGTMLRMCIMNA